MVLGGVGFVVGVGDAAVVAGGVTGGCVEEFGGFGVGEHDVVGVGAAGELYVGGFAVEGVSADRDGVVPGAALGAMRGEGVGVGDVPTPLQVVLVESDGGPWSRVTVTAPVAMAVMVPAWPLATLARSSGSWLLRRNTTRSPTRTGVVP